MNPEVFDKEKYKEILREIKPYFNTYLGKYTHKKSTESYYFRSLAFSREDMGYVFGFNIGFFQTEMNNYLDSAGMNVVIRLNGEKQEIRKQYADFFRDTLSEWQNTHEDSYSNSQRNGSGIILPRYKKLTSFQYQNDIITFLTDSIEKLNRVYPEIIKNPNNIFFGVVRAAPFWNEDIVNYCKAYIYNT